MSTQSWRSSFASVIGSSHLRQGTTCQDAGSCRIIQSENGSEILLAVVSDGAGSASKSDVGSRMTVDFFLKEFEAAAKGNECLTNITQTFVLQWLELVRKEMGIRAELEGVSLKEFACTVLGAVISQNHAVFFQIGDGAIVISKNDTQDYSPMFWPQHGEYANQTNFIVQDNFADTLEFAYLNEQFDKLALFTDGLERLILNFTLNTVHSPALESIFDWLARKEPVHDAMSCPALTAYLGSDFINSRTDDDKTLVIATRSSPL